MSQCKTWFKRLRLVLELDRADIVEIMRLAESPVSSSQADGWMRPDNDTRRSRPMSEAEFDAFTRGLVEWSKEKPRE